MAGFIEIIEKFDSIIIERLTNIVSISVELLVPPIATLSGMILLLIFTWDTILLMLGLEGKNPKGVIFDLVKKALILTVAGTAAYYNDYVSDPLIAIIIGLGQTVSGSAGEFSFAAERLIVGMRTYTEEFEKLGFTDFGPIIVALIKNIIFYLAYGALIVVSFIYLTINKLFFFLCLSFGPLFIFFYAFKTTKGWFSGWLNATFSFGMAYVFIKLIISTLISIATETIVFATGNEVAELIDTVIEAFIVALVCFSIYKSGDAVGQFFGTGNITDQIGGNIKRQAAEGKRILAERFRGEDSSKIKETK